MNLYEEILGAGMAVRYDDNGIVAFVLLDEDDHEIVVRTADLDPGWEKKLLTALNTPWRKS